MHPLTRLLFHIYLFFHEKVPQYIQKDIIIYKTAIIYKTETCDGAQNAAHKMT